MIKAFLKFFARVTAIITLASSAIKELAFKRVSFNSFHTVSFRGLKRQLSIYPLTVIFALSLPKSSSIIHCLFIIGIKFSVSQRIFVC